ncbi:Protein kinase alk2 [Boothiomyces macroporosus]|uniref:Protein kinase alk2 n=1 Tax=Boothiomyces macroporosus TaxID=261099 RepID=A0AAD5UD29_9FUNG|nr:Protein kinase alk2 [Boothiomyces macroporosus]
MDENTELLPSFVVQGRLLPCDTVRKTFKTPDWKVATMVSNNWIEKSKDAYYVGAAVIGLASAVYWYYKDDAIGAMVRVDKSVPRFKIHNPIFGGLLAMLKNVDESGNLISDEINDPGFDKAKVLTIPFAEPTIFVNDPESVEYITSTNFDNYVKGDYTKARMTDVLGNGIFNTDGHDWFTQRKLAAKILTNRNFKVNIETVFTDNIQIFINVLNQAVQEGQDVDMHSLFHRYFMDSFGEIAYGIEMGSLSKGIPNYVASFDRSQSTMGDRFINPFYRLADMLNPFLKTDVKLIREFGRKVVEDRKNGVHAGNKSDLLSLFMEQRNEDGTELSTDELADHVINFILAGRDTTSQALSWTLYCLYENPAAKAALVKEIDEILGSQLIPEYDQIKKLKYATAVFKETLRLYPSVPREGKLALNNDVLPNGVKIPKGAIVGFCPYAMGRSEKLWENASAYKPERWLNSKQPSNYVYTAFMCGPRICLGKNLAELQGVFTLVSILKNFDFEILDPLVVKQKMSLTLPMKNGLMCKITKRK